MENQKKTRKQRRETQNGAQFFNKLLFDFIDFEAKNTTEKNGFLLIKEDVNLLAGDLIDKWKTFCFNTRNNNKKQVGFKPEALKNSIDSHIYRHKNSTWSNYLIKVLKDKYGIDMPLSIADIYAKNNIKTKPFKIANKINKTLPDMYKIEIPEINFKKNIPEEISEMTKEEFIFFAKMLLKVFTGEMEVYDLKTAMALKFLNVKYNIKTYNKLPDDSKTAIGENINGLTELLDFFFVPTADNKIMFNTGFTKNLVSQLNVQFVPFIPIRLYGPADALTDINFLEYKDANTYYRAYLKSKNEDDLNRLIAVLYRPYILPFKLWRQKYKANRSFERRVRKISKIPIERRFAVYLFYMACEDFLRTGILNIDGQEINLKLMYETTLKEKQADIKQKYNSNTGLAGVAFSLAGTGIFGTIKEVYKQNLYDVIVLLYKQRIEYLNELENIKYNGKN